MLKGWDFKTIPGVAFTIADVRQPLERIAAFDLDSTLVTPKDPSKVFPVSRDDWRWWHPSVEHRLKELYHDGGWNIVIFSNQSGVSQGRKAPDEIAGKISDISEKLGIPISAFLALGIYNTSSKTVFLHSHFVSRTRYSSEACHWNVEGISSFGDDGGFGIR
jgi:DNA 3'-phosphatase